MRTAILYTRLSGYMNACLKELDEIDDVEIFVSNIKVSKDAPFDENLFLWIENRYQWVNRVDITELISRLDEFRPDVILCANWHNSGYRKVLKHFKGRSVRIFTSDRPWLGQLRQWLGVFTARYYLHPICEAFFVAGERQAVFAHKMGFKQANILRGLYSCDHQNFSKTYESRMRTQSEPRSFVFIGRFSQEKGLDVLVDAYRRYRDSTSEPWTLKCYGTGPLLPLIDDVEGVEYQGFCQPSDLPRELLQASCLILPSTFEPWGLVVHEAVTAGMSVITTDAVGASVHLVQDGYNGYIVETGDANELAQAMLRYSMLEVKERSIMSENSYRLSLQFTPKQWANNLLTKARMMLNKE